jgi:hypothetical protein
MGYDAGLPDTEVIVDYLEVFMNDVSVLRYTHDILISGSI